PSRPVPTAVYTTASVHVLNYGPAILNGDDTIQINSAPWTAQLASSTLITTTDPSTGLPISVPTDNPNDLLSPGQAQYLIDYDTHQIAIPSASYAQNFVFTVTVQDGNPVVQKTVTVSGALAAGDSGWKPVDLTSTGVSSSAKWMVGTAVLYRPFSRGDTGVLVSNHTLSAFGNDPYQFQVRYGSYGPHAANVGVIDFNPLAGGSSGTQPLKARISYLVYNWHILHEDHALPYKSEDRTVRLGIDNLKKLGDVQHDQSLFKGIFDSATTDEAADFMVCNLDTGYTAIFNSIDPVKGPATDLDSDTPNKQYVGVSYKNGRITFPIGNTEPTSPAYNDPNPTPNSNGVHIRIYYMGSADWGVALQKAPARFLPTSNKLDLVTNSAAPPNLYWVRSTGGALGVCFPNCDYGKTVEISGVLNYTDTSGNAAIMAISSVTSAINNPDQINFKDIGYINIGPVPANCDTTKPISISSVRGVSANALVVWRENDQWKSQIVDTLLPRN
ncbi:MAG: hypothetical protein ABIY70_09510, partial [Capsulimonas sp.]|uniref:hypothetical protein n=1 Tax=Capsulimonas sp. TaxID=2494211 RepID=UPI0032644500